MTKDSNGRRMYWATPFKRSFGDVESARRVVTLSFQEYSRIQQPYWKSLWLSTLDTPIDMLRRRGVIINVKVSDPVRFPYQRIAVGGETCHLALRSSDRPR